MLVWAGFIVMALVRSDGACAVITPSRVGVALEPANSVTIAQHASVIRRGLVAYVNAIRIFEVRRG
jgi:hypothetical protein